MACLPTGILISAGTRRTAHSGAFTDHRESCSEDEKEFPGADRQCDWLRSLVPVREDVVMSDNDDSEEGKVLGPMLDYTRYYPTTLPLHQPRHDGSEASTASDEVRPKYSLQSPPVIS